TRDLADHDLAALAQRHRVRPGPLAQDRVLQGRGVLAGQVVTGPFVAGGRAGRGGRGVARVLDLLELLLGQLGLPLGGRLAPTDLGQLLLALALLLGAAPLLFGFFLALLALGEVDLFLADRKSTRLNSS